MFLLLYDCEKYLAEQKLVFTKR